MTNPDYMIHHYSRIKQFKFFLQELQLQVSANIEANYRLWGDRLFIPWDMYSSILKHYTPTMSEATIGVLYPCVIWSFCKSKYKFSDEIKNLILESANDTIPINVFLNLREWAIYIDTTNCNLEINERKVLSATLCVSDININLSSHSHNKLSLCIILGLKADIKRKFYVLLVPMISDSITECLKYADIEYSEIAESHNVSTFGRKAPEEQRINLLKKLLNLFLYIQCENSVIVNKNSKHVKYKPNKKTNHIFSPRDIKTWIINTKEKFKGHLDVQKSSTTIKPHVRRGHFHGYWVGPRDNPLDLLIKWIPPIYVNASKITGTKIYD